jgi:hypothetical protein
MSNFGRTRELLIDRACGPQVTATNETYAKLVEQLGADVACLGLSKREEVLQSAGQAALLGNQEAVVAEVPAQA